MKVRILKNDSLKRFSTGEVGEVLENTFPEKYQYLVRLPGTIGVDNLFGKEGHIEAVRDFFFYADEVELLEDDGVTRKVKNYYIDVFERDGNYTVVLNDGPNYETLIRMKESVASELRDKLNEILPERIARGKKYEDLKNAQAYVKQKNSEIKRCSVCGFILDDKELCQNVNCDLHQFEFI